MIIGCIVPLLVYRATLTRVQLQLRAVRIRPIGHILRRKVSPTFEGSEILRTRHMAPPYAVREPLINVNCWAALPSQSARITGEPLAFCASRHFALLRTGCSKLVKASKALFGVYAHLDEESTLGSRCLCAHFLSQQERSNQDEGQNHEYRITDC